VGTCENVQRYDDRPVTRPRVRETNRSSKGSRHGPSAGRTQRDSRGCALEGPAELYRLRIDRSALQEAGSPPRFFPSSTSRSRDGDLRRETPRCSNDTISRGDHRPRRSSFAACSERIDKGPPTAQGARETCRARASPLRARPGPNSRNPTAMRIEGVVTHRGPSAPWRPFGRRNPRSENGSTCFIGPNESGK